MTATHEMVKSVLAGNTDPATLDAIDSLPEDTLSRLIQDAASAQAALLAGDRQSALDIIAPYREMAAQFGLEAVYDAIIDGAI